MRLEKLNEIMPGAPVGDVSRVCKYRPELFGEAFIRAVHTALRGPSAWQVGERELFAAFVSSLNQCRY